MGIAGPNTGDFTWIPVGWDQRERRGTGPALPGGWSRDGGAQRSPVCADLPGRGWPDPPGRGWPDPLLASASPGWALPGLLHPGLGEALLSGAWSCCSALSGTPRRAGTGFCPAQKPFCVFSNQFGNERQFEKKKKKYPPPACAFQ